MYSTCSLNPIEDEAVVATILQQMGSNVRLKDMSNQYPLLKRQKGLSSWKVIDDNHVIHDHWTADCSIPSTCFPSSSNESLHLDYCMRFLPHQNNSGGFFIAVFEKVGELSEELPDCVLSGVLKTEQE